MHMHPGLGRELAANGGRDHVADAVQRPGDRRTEAMLANFSASSSNALVSNLISIMLSS
jgi:hypothetical protein